MDFEGKKIVIAGYGLEGKSVLRYLQSNGVKDWQITIADQKQSSDVPGEVAMIVGDDVFAQLQHFDIVFRSPSIRPDSIITDGVIWSSTNEFFKKCPAKIVGVTGTNGKGTTTTLISRILEEAGATVHVVGNIGIPALDSLSDIGSKDVVVFELSSFQLWDLTSSPAVAVVLMIAEDHMDVHENMEEYIAAKSVIVQHQSKDDLLVYNAENKLTKKVVKNAAATTVPYLKSPGATVVGEAIVIDEQKICSVDSIGLSGSHNIENVCAAVTVAWQFTKEIMPIQKAIQEFKGLPHRMEFVGEKAGVKYYNDSNASIAIATSAALRSFDGSSRVLVFGGYDKGVDSSAALSDLTAQDHVVLIGQTGSKFEEMLKAQNVPYVNLGTEVTMREIVEKCQSIAQPGSVVLLSPAHASFDMFDNLYQRGTQFRDEVNSLSN